MDEKEDRHDIVFEKYVTFAHESSKDRGKSLDLGFLELGQILSKDIEHMLSNEIHVAERLIEGFRGRGACRERK